jgi:hypothetical protein
LKRGRSPVALDSAAVGPTAEEAAAARGEEDAGADAEAEAEAEAEAKPEWCSERASTSEQATAPTVDGRLGVLQRRAFGDSEMQ